MTVNSDNLQNSSVTKPNEVTNINTFSDFSIGSLLLRMGKITQDDADRIMQLHKDKGMKFGEAAQSLGLVTEADIAKVLAQQFDYPYLSSSVDAYNEELVAAYQPFSSNAESLRAVRSQLMLRWFSSSRKALAISSVNSGDGASYVAANLAVVFSQLGEKTLLIDANLRKPRQHQIYNLNEKTGLSDILAGRADLSVISKIDSFENLSVLFAGTLPPNPQELVSRTSFRALINNLHSLYDVIIVDTPATSLGADAASIAAALGGVLLVAKKNQTKNSKIEDFIEDLNASGSQIVGSVLLDF